MRPERRMNGKRQRPHKWQTVFARLRTASVLLEDGNRPQAIEEAGAASDWAAKWSGRFREETSMGMTLAAAIEERVIRPLSMGKLTPAAMTNTIAVLEHVVEREAKVAAVHNAQAKLRTVYTGRTPDAARDRAVAAALRQVRSELEAAE